MVDVALLKELLEKFLTSEYRDLYSVGGMAVSLFLLWARVNVTWSPKYLFKNTRAAWNKMPAGDDDGVIRVMCCTAPMVADILLAAVHGLAGFSRRPASSQAMRTLHDAVMKRDTEAQDELQLLRENLDEAKRGFSKALKVLREKTLVIDVLERQELLETTARLEASVADLTAKTRELEDAYCLSLDETVMTSIARVLARDHDSDLLELRERLNQLDTDSGLRDPGAVEEAIALYQRLVRDADDEEEEIFPLG